MKLKVVTLTTDLKHPGLLKLQESLERHGYDYHIIHQQVPSGMHVFGTQMPHVYNWCKNESEGYTHLLYTDAWDTVALGPFTELLSKVDDDILFLGSGEKACFPKPELAAEYPADVPNIFAWKYINGGGWLANVKFFCEMYEDLPAEGINDQLWLAQRFLLYNKIHGTDVRINYPCDIFQTIGFEGKGDFAVKDKRLVNLLTGEQPLFAHGNGRTAMDWVWNIPNSADYVRLDTEGTTAVMQQVLQETKDAESAG